VRRPSRSIVILRRVAVTLWFAGLVACSLAWVRSYRTAEAWTRFTVRWTEGRIESHERVVASNWGTLLLFDRSRSRPRFRDAEFWDRRSDPERTEVFRYAGRALSNLGFFWEADVTPHGGLGFGAQSSADARDPLFQVVHGVAVSVRYWLIEGILCVPLLGAAVRRVRRSRTGPDGSAACRRCGYDLRATPGRCPECGTVAKA
jgi:hypothetical protein